MEEKLYEILQRIEAKLDRRETSIWTLEQEEYAYSLYKDGLDWFELARAFNKHFGLDRGAGAVRDRLSKLGLLKAIDKPSELRSPTVTIYTDPPF